ncbi:hypothetical protein [Halomonas sp. HG01]|uniref:hypothetical protein n=1 Tax=Halomonas sp. HG01 TaxID=1609967 RepID=UPI000614629C|nr:hypothetical protein [Halomonas sp. HG01]
MNKTHEELCEEVQQLRQGIRQLAANLSNGEWADLLTADQDLGDLEDAARSLTEQHGALEAARTDLDGVAAQFGEIGRLVPTDYQDRSELFGALLRIIQKVPSGARARAEASALRRYAMRLHEKHDWRDHLLVEADRIEQNAKELSHG